MRISEKLHIKSYVSKTLFTLDGKAWILTCLGSVVCLVDLLLGTVLLLLFSPLLVFLILVRSRQLPFSSHSAFVWLRSILCVVVFFVVNFWS
jgi:hypothetical protein